MKGLPGAEAVASAGVNQLQVLKEYHEKTGSAAAPHWENRCQESEDDVLEEESVVL